MRFSLFLIVLGIVILTAGCVGGTSVNLFRPESPPLPPNYLNCNGTWFNTDNQTCCGNIVYAKRDGFQCTGDGFYINDTEFFTNLSTTSEKDSVFVGQEAFPSKMHVIHTPIGPPQIAVTHPVFTPMPAISGMPVVNPTGVPALYPQGIPAAPNQGVAVKK
jgi:hypothetical protein